MLKRIREILTLHEGKKNPITSAEIEKELDIIEHDTHAQTRALIFDCAKQYNLPLAAGNKGYYYLITDQEEYEEYMNNLDARSVGIEERKRIITKNFKEKKQ